MVAGKPRLKTAKTKTAHPTTIPKVASADFIIIFFKANLPIHLKAPRAFKLFYIHFNIAKDKNQLFENIHKRETQQYKCSMKKLFIPLAAAVCAAALGGCTKNAVDYTDYISENRYNIYLYSDGGTEIKIYCSEKESPFVADGIKGNINALTEIYLQFDEGFDEVYVTSPSFTGGEASYLTVKGCWYLSFSGYRDEDGIELTVTCDGESRDYTLETILYDGVMSAEETLQYAVDYDGATFESLKRNGIFYGEIFLRLLYDAGKCYRYVGVCDRDGKIKAYLLDGETGRVIAERDYNM